MPRAKATKPEFPTRSSKRLWQWAVVLGLITGIVIGSAYAVIQYANQPAVEGSETARVEPQKSSPVAQVVVGRERYALDEHGVRLPPPTSNSQGLLEIQGVESPPRGNVGAKWGTPVVEAAARLARLIEVDRQQLAITAIEVDENNIQPELRLRTNRGTRVIWQRWPESAGEKSVGEEEKLNRLRIYVEREGSLDKPAGPYVIDVRPVEGYLRKEMTTK